ncbi:MAG: aromatic ring-hydroxylating dioxygenase subunit alpha, partial [Comamonadaceae bacterium]
MWLRNCWYVIAWDHEIHAADAPQLFTRTVLGEPILVMRTADGALVALEDRCCHRLAPLSQGRREGDCVRCGYHGLKFDPSGKCVEAPGIPIIPAKARVRTYPVALKNRWVFVWMGDPALADPALLPDAYSNDHPDWKNRPGYLHYDTPYLLICDNLLDFSHLSYVHANTLGGSTAIAEAPARLEEIPHGIRVTRTVDDVPPSAFWRSFQTFSGNVDRYFIYDFVLPGTLLMQSGGRPAGQAADDPRGGVELHSCQTLTPETETSTHYFFQQSHRSHVGGPQT